MRISRSVQRSAAISSRQTGCEEGSPATRKALRSLSRASSSLWNAARRRVLREDRRDARVVGDQQRAGRRAHEHLYARRAGQALQLGNVGDIVVRAADPEGEIAVHAVRGAQHLVGERLGGGGQRLGVGHFEYRGDAAEHGGARAGLEVLLVLEPRLAEMHLAVDHAGQNVRPAAIDALARRSASRDRRSRRCGRR